MTIENATKKVLAGAAAAAGALAGYAFLVEPRWLEVTRTNIHVRNLHPALEGFTIALLTDLHVGEGTPLSLIRRACRLTMGERPDLVAITGDLVADDAPGFREVLDAVQGLAAPYGVYAVPGNHDHRVGIDRFRRDLAAQDAVGDLTNRAEVLDVDGARFCVAGVDDLSYGDPDLGVLPPPDERDFTLLLAHDPDQAERDDLYEEGLRRRPWTQVYTSRGVGTVRIPIRFLCRPEVAMLTLTGAPRPPRPS
jgi:predicted MPP superfamily phosphohydrolase